MKPKNRKTVGDYAFEVLQSANKPMHIKEIIPLMVKAGWECKSKNLRQVAYTSLHGLLTREGPECQFVLLGNGFWATQEMMKNGAIQDSGVDIRNAPQRGVTPTYTDIPEDKRNCGNCAFIQYPDVAIIARKEGSCTKYLESKHNGVQSKMPACPCWYPRSVQQKFKDIDEGRTQKLLITSKHLAPHQQRLRGRDAYVPD